MKINFSEITADERNKLAEENLKIAKKCLSNVNHDIAILNKDQINKNIRIETLIDDISNLIRNINDIMTQYDRGE